MGEQNYPGVSDPIVEADFAFRGLGFEIRGDLADLQRHNSPPSLLGYFNPRFYMNALRRRNSDRNETAMARVARGGRPDRSGAPTGAPKGAADCRKDASK
jgi:hypothetical protein